ncbi:MAG TPA: cytochrome P460 family protein [Terriglobales bacterium]|nr:cytochrome P460 family protein [Terriglobales bacterium]
MPKSRTILIVAAVILLQVAGVSQHAGSSTPSYTTDGNLQLPADYRSWVYLSSGLGMTYGANATPNTNPMFTNVFVKPEAYRAFLNTGTWPDKTVFMLEERASGTNVGPNRAGHFQTDLRGVATLVKDETRFPEKWRFFIFDTRDGLPVGSADPVKTKACLDCHTKNGAVDHTFVQFYPTLKRVAIEKGTYKEPKE